MALFKTLFGSGGRKGPFVMDGHHFSAKEFGYYSVKWAVESTIGTIKSIDKTENRLYAAICEGPGIAHQHLTALQIGAYLISAMQLCEETAVLREIQAGISDGISVIQNDRGPIDQAARQVYEKAYRNYGYYLGQDLRTPIPEGTLVVKPGESAKQASRNIEYGYGLEGYLDANPVIDVQVMYLITTHGIGAMHVLSNDLQFRYEPRS